MLSAAIYFICFIWELPSRSQQEKTKANKNKTKLRKILPVKLDEGLANGLMVPARPVPGKI